MAAVRATGIIAMSHVTERPRTLLIVAMLFISIGMIALLRMAIRFLTNDPLIDLQILALFIGKGLLDCSTNWLKVARLFSMCHLILLPLVPLIRFCVGMDTKLRFYGFYARSITTESSLILSILLFLLSLWAYRTLWRTDVVACFETSKMESAPLGNQ